MSEEMSEELGTDKLKRIGDQIVALQIQRNFYCANPLWYAYCTMNINRLQFMFAKEKAELDKFAKFMTKEFSGK